jgi:hypothetical protein
VLDEVRGEVDDIDVIVVDKRAQEFKDCEAPEVVGVANKP